MTAVHASPNTRPRAPLGGEEGRNVDSGVGASVERSRPSVPEIEKVIGMLEIVSKHRASAPKKLSIITQLFQYGKVAVRKELVVELDYSEFAKRFAELERKLDRVPIHRTPYSYKWVKPRTPLDKDVLEQALAPLGSFRFKGELKLNPKYYEAVATYVRAQKVVGKVFYTSDNMLVVFSRVTSSTGSGSYYTMLVLKPDNGRVKGYFMCTCPYAMGLTVDRHGRRMSPAFTGICKHGIALIYYYYPEIAAYLRLAEKGELSESRYNVEAETLRKGFEEFQKKLEQIASVDGGAAEVAISNAAYALVRDVVSRVNSIGELEKLVPDTDDLGEIRKLWNSIKVVAKTREEEQGGEEAAASEEETVDVPSIIAELEKTGLYDRIDQLRAILNGLQGSRRDTPYTIALLAGLILGSDLESDPVIVSVVGDPGTGKTLTASGLARLLGVRSIVVEKEVTEADLAEEAEAELSEKIAAFMGFFEKVIEKRIPPEKREEAEKFFEAYVEKSASVAVEGKAKDLVSVAKEFADAFTSLYGVSDKKAKARIARLFFTVLKTYRRVYSKYMSRRAVKEKAHEIRRMMLEKLAELGLIPSTREKEEENGGSVKWEVDEKPRGYVVRVAVDTHYLLSRYGGDPEKIREVVEKLAEVGDRVYMRVEKPGMAEIKLSEAEYLEKALRVREEDVLSPSKKLIWKGGELKEKALILIDEARRYPELLERLLTDLSTAGRDKRRTSIVVTTDNAEPLMNAESDPRLDAFISRVNFEVITPSATVPQIIGETLDRMLELEKQGKTPLLFMDEALILSMVAEKIPLTDRQMLILHSIPILLTYEMKVLRPEVVVGLMTAPINQRARAPPLVLIAPRGSLESVQSPGDYQDVYWGDEAPAIRMVPERRFGHHVARASKALAAIRRLGAVDDETFLSALKTVLTARVVPLNVEYPYLYLNAKAKTVSAIVEFARDFLSSGKTATERLMEILSALAVPDEKTLGDALDEMIRNPVVAAIFVRFVEQMLVSENAEEFVKLSVKIPGLFNMLRLVAELEKIAI